MFKLKLIILFILFVNVGFSQEIFLGEYSNRYVSYKSINELNSHRIFTQLILFDDNKYKLTTQTFVYIRKIKKRKIINCSTIFGKWKKEGNYITLISEGFNNLTTYKIKNDRKIILIDNNFKANYHIKLKKVENIIKIECNEKDNIPDNDLN